MAQRRRIAFGDAFDVAVVLTLVTAFATFPSCVVGEQFLVNP